MVVDELEIEKFRGEEKEKLKVIIFFNVFVLRM